MRGWTRRDRFQKGIPVNHRPRLSDILGNSAGNDIDKLWNETEAAADYKPLPPGTYVAHLIEGMLERSRTGTPCFKLTFKVIEGPFENRRIWHEIWLTPKSMPMAKRDLLKLGFKSPQQMEQPVPQWLRCRVQVVIHRDDDGTERNRVRDMELVGRDTPEADPFAPEGGVA
jgi:hypothetical protein